MTFRAVSLLALAAACAFAGPAAAWDPLLPGAFQVGREREHSHRNVFAGASGQRIRIGAVIGLRSDCVSLKSLRFRVVAPPAHGEVSIAQGATTARYKPLNPRSECNGRRVPATFVFYRSEPGFHGRDEVEYETTGSNDEIMRIRAVVEVR